MTWYHISFEDGSNPYICKDKRELLRLAKKYGKRLVEIKEQFYLVKKGEN